jgi:signal transduction histidine kinase
MNRVRVQLKERRMDGNKQRVSVVLLDKELNQLVSEINDNLQAEENLRLSDVRKEKRFKELIADISHDLRTPLTSIKGYQQLLLKTKLDAYQQDKLDVAMKHTEELGGLIEHFFEYSYLVNIEPELKPENINVTNLVIECIVASVTVLEQAGIKIQMEENPPVMLVTDKELLTRIVENLLRNCVQHAKGEVVVSIKRVKEKETTKTNISFSNAIGEDNQIDPDKLFDRFYTGDHARSRSTGLGLAIVKLLAQYLGGEAIATVHDQRLTITVKI